MKKYINFSNKDKEIMILALEKAKVAGKEENFPIGAALTINGDLINVGSNALKINRNWYSHAENNLIEKNSKLILEETKKGSLVEIFSTLEPCFMCFGTVLLHRIPKITYGCVDPHGGVTNVSKEHFPPFYRNRWPEIRGGLFAKESYELMMDFINSKKDIPEFTEMFELYRNLKV